MPIEEVNRNLPPTALADKLVSELMLLASMLYPNQQRIIKRFCDIILQNRAAVADSTVFLPLEAALMVIQVEEHMNMNSEITKLHKRLDESSREIDELRNLLHELRNLLNGKT